MLTFARRDVPSCAETHGRERNRSLKISNPCHRIASQWIWTPLVQSRLRGMIFASTRQRRRGFVERRTERSGASSTDEKHEQFLPHEE